MHLAYTKYYQICLDYKFNKVYVIWISDDDADKVHLGKNDKIYGFESSARLLKYAKEQNIKIESDISYNDFYELQQWLINTNKQFDYATFLNIWNLFIDVSEALNKFYLGNKKGVVRDKIYDKLYDGCGLWTSDNLQPSFNKRERKKLQDILQQGLSLLQKNLYIVE